MRKAIALLATIGAFMFVSAGPAAAQQYPGTTTTTVITTTTTAPTTTTTAPVTTTTAPTTTEDAGVAAGGAAAGAGGALPRTGSDSMSLAQGAIVLLAVGGLTLLAGRRYLPSRVSTRS
jgi:LPXTG-motif cell wall-anchored protein